MLKARQFHTADFETFDHIFCMDRQNREDILALSQNEGQASKVHLFMDALYPDSPTDVPDPYFGGDEGFKKVFQMVDDACHAWIDKWTES
jgi:protein-tyrosine phosphatase